MKPNHKSLMLFALLLLCLDLQTIYCKNCECFYTKPPNSLPDRNKNFIVKDEIIDGKNYGKPIFFGDFVILSGNFHVPKSVNYPLKSDCPKGWRMPTINEYKKMISNFPSTLAYSDLQLEINFGAAADQIFVAQEKSYPGITDPTNNNSWMWKSIFFDSSTKKVIEYNVHLYFDEDYWTKCVLDSKLPIPIKTHDKDFILGKAYEASIAMNNMASVLWKYEDQIAALPEVTLTFQKPGCSYIQVWGKDMSNQEHYSCIEIFVTNPFGSDGSPDFRGSSSINRLQLTETASRQEHMFFNAGNAPIAPTLDGGMYIAFNDYNSKELTVSWLDLTMKAKKTASLNVKAFPMDIVATRLGFAVYAKMVDDFNHSFLAEYDHSFKMLFKKIIMNNGKRPTEAKEQISFYDKNGELFDGIQVMFVANNAKLSYGRGKIGLIFTHYNFFGYSNSKEREDHTGDTYFVFEEKTGSRVTYAWPWKVSHSMYQTHVYDGRYFITSSLGDLYPENIKVCFIEMDKFNEVVDSTRKYPVNHPSYCKDLVTGVIPGDGRGNTCGRIAGFMYLQNKYALLYTRKPCSLTNANGTTSSNSNEMTLITFKFEDNEFVDIKETQILKDVSELVAVRAGKYGDKIFVTWASVLQSTGDDPQNQFLKGNEIVSAMLIDFNGLIVHQSFKPNNYIVSPSDDMRYLANGSLAWGIVTPDNKIEVYWTNPPPVLHLDTKSVSTLYSVKVDASVIKEVLKQDSIIANKEKKVIVDGNIDSNALDEELPSSTETSKEEAKTQNSSNTQTKTIEHHHHYYNKNKQIYHYFFHKENESQHSGSDKEIQSFDFE